MSAPTRQNQLHDNDPHPSGPIPVSNPEKRKVPKVAIIAGAGIVAVGATFATLNMLTPEENDASTSTSNDYDASPEQAREMDMNKYDISSFDYAKQLNAVMPFLEEHRQASLDAIAAQSGVFVDPNQYSGDKKKAQEMLNNFAADIWTATSQTNVTLGQNLINGVYADTAASQSVVREQIGQGSGNGKLERHTVDAVSGSFDSGYIYIPGGNSIPITSETILINSVDNDDTAVWNTYVAMQKSEDGQYEVPVIIAQVKHGDMGFVDGTAVADWHPSTS